MHLSDLGVVTAALIRIAATLLACGALAQATYYRVGQQSETYHQAGRLFLVAGGIAAAAAIALSLLT